MRGQCRYELNARQRAVVGYNGADFGPIWAKIMHGVVSGSVMITPDFVPVWVNIMHELCCSMGYSYARLCAGTFYNNTRCCAKMGSDHARFVPGRLCVGVEYDNARPDNGMFYNNSRRGAGMDCNVALHCADMYNNTRVLWQCGS